MKFIVRGSVEYAIEMEVEAEDEEEAEALFEAMRQEEVEELIDAEDFIILADDVEPGEDEAAVPQPESEPERIVRVVGQEEGK